jgi:hypothetical protein
VPRWAKNRRGGDFRRHWHVFADVSGAICGFCGGEIVADRAEHYRGHLENARAYLELVEKSSGDPSWSATAREWIECSETVLAEPESGTVN